MSVLTPEWIRRYVYFLESDDYSDLFCCEEAARDLLDTLREALDVIGRGVYSDPGDRQRALLLLRLRETLQPPAEEG